MKFNLIKTDKSSLDNIPVSDGNFIVLKDEDGIHYDMDGNRHPMNNGAIGEWYQYNPSISDWETTEHVNVASGKGAHVEGTGNVASGEGSHAEGATGQVAAGVSEAGNIASGKGAHAEGVNTSASGEGSHAEGNNTYASGDYSHAEGVWTYASGSGSHAEGGFYSKNLGGYVNTTAAGVCSHAGGTGTVVTGDHAFGHGYGIIANSDDVVVFGRYPRETQGTGTVFAVGNGISENNRSNAFHVTDSNGSSTAYCDLFFGDTSGTHHGDVIGDVEGNATFEYFETTLTPGSPTSEKILGHYTYTSGQTNNAYNTFYVKAQDGVIHSRQSSISGVDYAEYIYPWFDNNEQDEDRCGYFVTVKDKKLYKATTQDIVVGVTSGAYGIIGTPDALDEWHDRWIKDEFGRFVLNDEGQLIQSEDYDPSREYHPRSERKEWSAVGILGQVVVRDDGTCQEGQLCKTDDNGVATLSQDNSGYLVLERTGDNSVKILFK